jgi:hypothetical protein
MTRRSDGSTACSSGIEGERESDQEEERLHLFRFDKQVEPNLPPLVYPKVFLLLSIRECTKRVRVWGEKSNA